MLWEQISLLTESYLQQLLDILNWSSSLLPLFQQSSTVYIKKKQSSSHCFCMIKKQTNIWKLQEIGHIRGFEISW